MNTTELIRLEGVSLTYPTVGTPVPALSGVSLSVGPGSTWPWSAGREAVSHRF